MGAITNQKYHDECVSNLRNFGKLSPHFVPHFKHHFRNPLSSIILGLHLSEKNIEERNMEALKNDLARIKVAIDHMLDDMNEVGI